MTEPILRIPPKRYGGETTVISMRVTRDLLKAIDTAAEMSGRNRNEIMNMSLEFALNHMEIVLHEQGSAQENKG